MSNLVDDLRKRYGSKNVLLQPAKPQSDLVEELKNRYSQIKIIPGDRPKPQPKPRKLRVAKNRLATLDYETDPFQVDRIPKPFAAGFYDGEQYILRWGPDCVQQIVDAIHASPNGPFLIYAHNGGKFDFYLMLKHLRQHMRVVGGSRIIQGHLGTSEVRDSFAIMPFALAKYQKMEIDYAKLEANVRDKHRPEIEEYLHLDCLKLYDLVSAFHEEFGDQLTVGGTALKELRHRHDIQTGGRKLDETFRKDFYFGGRVQVFESGIIKGPVRIYDVNSMYPHVMSTMLHPVGNTYEIDTGQTVRRKTCFVIADGVNYGAFPKRLDNGSLDFTVERGRFSVTIHEWEAALDTNTFKPDKIIRTYRFRKRITFEEFVSHFYNARQLATIQNDLIRALFYKYVLNSAYGKFAQNPENFREYIILESDDAPEPYCKSNCKGTDEEPCEKWHVESLATDHGYIVWSKPSLAKTYYNVCTGASITGAARAVLWRGICSADRPLYCDTDSIICKSLRNVPIDPTKLGAWKLEAKGDSVAISGKKMYGVWNGNECIKKAHKGSRLTPAELLRVAKGETIYAENNVPAFRLNGSHLFIGRHIKRTA